MLLFEWTLLLLLGAVLLAGLARRLGIPYPALLALAGAALAFVPGAPAIEIAPDLALALFIAPVLLDAAFDTSPRDLKRNIVPLASLAVVAVILTTLAVAFVGWKMAGLPIAAAIALGAIVAPPDAAAAAAVLTQFRPSRRVMHILEGESLLNDATALLIYRMAVIAAGGAFSLASVGPLVVAAVIGSVAGGYAMARLYLFATANVRDAPSSTVLQFVSTFGVWMIADRLALSPIITMVVYAMVLARWAPRRMAARNRVSSYSVWEAAVFVLNVLAFVLMGLQARPIMERLSSIDRLDALVFGAAVLATCIIVRIAWVFCHAAAARSWQRLTGSSSEAGREEMRNAFLVSWCGMRGLVTLATAFALPSDFPGRDLILLSAFFVVLGTLVLQGTTLNPLRRLLRLSSDDSLEREISRARVAIMQAAIDSLADKKSTAAATVREQYAAAREIAENIDAPQAATDYDRLRLRAIAAQREALYRMRAKGAIGDEAFHRLEEEIDWAELDAAPAGSFQPLTT
jgi:Na+/H+ antiporter